MRLVHRIIKKEKINIKLLRLARKVASINLKGTSTKTRK